MQTLARPVSDHTPYTLVIGTMIPKSSQFRIENYWTEFARFLDVVILHWHNNHFFANIGKMISGKFKQLRKGLKQWRKEFSNLGKLINNCNWVLAMLDGLEEQRSLSLIERYFRKSVKEYLLNLLEAKRKYWKQRSTIRWAKFGDENSVFFSTNGYYCTQQELYCSFAA